MAPQDPAILPPWTPRLSPTGDACVAASSGRVLDDDYAPYPLGMRWLDSSDGSAQRSLSMCDDGSYR